MNYSPEFKEAMLRRMLPPNNESITKIAKEEGLSEQTLRNWRDKARKEGYAAPGTDASPDDWSTQDKFLIVVETASLNEAELAEYARKKVSAKYSCGFSKQSELPIIVDERYLDYFTTIMEDRLWQVLAKPAFQCRNSSGLSMNAGRAA